MGSPGAEPDRIAQDEAMHRVRIPHSFCMATTEVTTAQFKRFLDANPKIKDSCAINLGSDREPIGWLTWFEAAQYCRWLSEKENVSENQMCYPRLDKIKEGMKLPANFLELTGYRLPTDEEWEYACRAGTETGRICSDEVLENYAWYVRNSPNQQTMPVAQLKPNDFGLFDILGNVGEWCHAHERDSEHRLFGTLASPGDTGPERSGDPRRYWRGGSYLSLASRVRSAAVWSYLATARAPMLGFRIARTQR
jgi:formylglycine-generating enzyme required for sulfatase activity